MNLDPGFYPELASFASSVATPAEWFLRFMYSESGLDPAAGNSLGYSGLNQISASYLRSKGIDPADYRTWPASRQLREVIEPFLRAQLHYLGTSVRSPGVLYALNFLPGQVKARGDGPDAVLAAENGPGQEPSWYAANKGRDVNHDGEITIGDLDAILERGAQSKTYASALQSLSAYAPITTSLSPTGLGWGMGVAAGLVAMSTFALAAMVLRRRAHNPLSDDITVENVAHVLARMPVEADDVHAPAAPLDGTHGRMSCKRRRAIECVLEQEEPPGWSGDVRILGIPFDSGGPAIGFPDRDRYPVAIVRVRDLVASQTTVDRAHMLHLLEVGWTHPILVMPWQGKLLIQDGHHRAYAQHLLGRSLIAAQIAPPVPRGVRPATIAELQRFALGTGT